MSDHTEVMPLEVAEQEFERFASLWDIDTNTKNMGEDDVASFDKAKRPLLRGFCEGWLTCDEEGRLTFALKFSKKLIDSGTTTVTLDPARSDVLSMDRFKDREAMHKIRAYMASLSGLPLGKFGQIDGRDEKRLRGVVLLFLGS